MGRVRLGRTSGCSNTPHWTRNDILNLQRAISMKISIENGKISNQTTMGERMERIGEVWIVDETDCFRLDFYQEDARAEGIAEPSRLSMLYLSK